MPNDPTYYPLQTLRNQIQHVDWIGNQRTFKPDDRYGLGEYQYGFALGAQARRPSFLRGPLYARWVEDPLESMSFVSRSRTRPLGAGAPPQNIFKGLDLNDVYRFNRDRSCHSGQFQRNIQLMYGNEDGIPWVDNNRLYGL